MILRQRFNLFISYQKYVNIVCTKNIHLSLSKLVRKPSSARKSSYYSFEDVPEDTISDTYPNPPRNTNVFKNFYGIEGDEGVIIVNELDGPKNPIQALNNKTFTPIDEFRSFNFGAIRLDNENKPTYAPRLRRNRNSNKDLNTDEVKDEEQSNSHGIVKHNKEELNSFPYLDVKQNISKDLFNYDDSEQVSNGSDKNGLNAASDIISSLSENIFQSTKRESTEDNFSNDLHADIHASDYSKQGQHANQNLYKISESYIDKEYFDETCTQNSSHESPNNIVQEQLTLSKSDYETTLDNQLKKSSSEITTKNFFVCNETSNSGTICDTGFNQNINFPAQAKKVIDLKYKENTSSYEKKEQKENFMNKTDVQTSAFQIEEPQTNLIEEQFFENKHDSLILSNQETFDDLRSKKGDISQKDGHPNTNINTFFTKVSKKQTNFSKDNNQPKRTLSSTDNQNKGAISEEAINSSHKLQEKETLVENKIETALDFVKKLRGNNLLSDEVKKGISAKKEKKVDSKGFRILKHQVPTLKYFTRDEMLELLKNSVLYADEDVVVLNKPYNLVIHESSTSQDLTCLSGYLDDLAKLLDHDTNSPKLLTVHRLDKETTGCLLLARNDVSAARLKSLFAQRKISKTYWIVTINVPDPMKGIIDIPISEGKVENRSRMVLHPKLPDDVPYVSHSKAGKQAVTQYSVIAVSGNAALVEVKPETGIKHQIRVHFGFGLGCPILGDHKYSYLDKLVPQKLPSDLLQKLGVRQSKVRHIPLHIHSKHVFIPQYSNERNLFVTAPLPKHMVENLRFLKFKRK